MIAFATHPLRSKRAWAIILLVALVMSLSPFSVITAHAGHGAPSLSMSPTGPANNNAPHAVGTTLAGSTVTIHTSSTCANNAQVGSATADATTGAYDIALSVTDNSSTTFYAKSKSGGDTSPCSSGVVYLEDSAAPSATLTTPQTSATEGSTVTYNFSASDANLAGASGIATTGTSGNCGTGGSKVSGSDTFSGTTGSASGTGSFQCLFADGPASPNVSVTVTDRASNNSTSSATAVTVSNVGPTVTFTSGNQTPSTGTTYTYNYSISDPGADTISSVATSCGTNGTKTNATNTNAAGSFDCTWSADASTTVTAQATDSDSSAGNTASRSVTVSTNDGPTVTFSGSNTTTVNEGAPATTYNYTISDPEGDTISSVATSCGTGGTKSDATNTNTAGSFKCTWADGPSSPSISVTATDSVGATGAEATQAITVNNVAPTVTLSGATTANEGDTKTYTYTVSDPGSDSHTITESCGASATRTDTAAANSFDCTFPDGPASSTVSVSADDGDTSNTTGSDSEAVTVSNVAPTVTFTSGNQTPSTGTTYTYNYSISDPGADTISSVATSCGTNGTKTNATNTNAAGSFDCTWSADASTTVTAQATDSDSSAGNTASRSVTVSDQSAPTGQAPTANAASVSTLEDSPVTVTLSGSDPQNDALSFKVTSLPANGKLYNGDNTSDPEIAAADLPATVNGTNQVTYQRTGDFTGDDSFTFIATDGTNDSAPATVSVSVIDFVPQPLSPPVQLSVTPNSPSNDNFPRIKGTSAHGTIRIYTDSSCTTAPVATGSSSDFQSSGLAVSVGDGTTTTFWTTVTSSTGLTSTCSHESITYIEDSIAPSATIARLATTSDSGISDSDSVTNDTSPTYFGVTEPGATVAIAIDGAPVSVVAADITTGVYEFTAPELTDGDHDITTQPTDRAGNIGPVAAVSVEIDTIAIAVAPEWNARYISPNGDRRRDRLEVTSPLDETAGWTFEVQPGGVESDPVILTQVIASQVSDPVYAASGEAKDKMRVTWNGVGTDGLSVEDSTYAWELTVTDRAGNAAEPITKTVVVDRQAPVVQALSVAPNPFRPKRHGKAKVTFELTEAGRVRVNIRRVGKHNRVLSVGVRLSSAGNVWIRWDGKNQHGRPVAPGRYRVIIRATDRAQNLLVNRAATIKVMR